MSLEVELYGTYHITMSCRIVSIRSGGKGPNPMTKPLKPKGMSGYCIVVKVDGTITHRCVTCEIADSFLGLTHSNEFEGVFTSKGDTYDVPYIRSTWIVVIGGEIRNVFPMDMFLSLYSPNPHCGLISKETTDHSSCCPPQTTRGSCFPVLYDHTPSDFVRQNKRKSTS